MNTYAHTSSTTTRTIALAACLAVLFAGAQACGAEHRAGAATGTKQEASANFIQSARANQDAYLRQLIAQRRAGAGAAASADDRRQPVPIRRHRSGDDRREPGHTRRKAHTG